MHVGRLQTLSVIPVLPGDSLQLSIDSIFRLAPTRKEIVSECQFDVFGFYVKHRHRYLEDWEDWIQGGVDYVPSFFTTIPIADAAHRNPVYLGLNQCGATLPELLPWGYNFIYQRYFAVPSTSTNGDGQGGFENLDWYPQAEAGADNTRLYGRLAARLPHIMNGASKVQGLNADGFDVNLDEDDRQVDTSGNFLDLASLAQTQARYKSELDRAFFASFYSDIMEKTWNQFITTDQDNRPELLFREKRFISGTEIAGTDDATLGSFVGKTIDRVTFSTRRKAFTEHGYVWIMALPRYPLIHTDEGHKLIQQTNPSYIDMIAERTIVAGQTYQNFAPEQWLTVQQPFTPTAALAEPPVQHYRFQPNRVHPHFKEIPGYPFTQFSSGDIDDYAPYFYHTDEEYADTFQTSQLGQAQLHALINCTKFSLLPPAITNIYAGARNRV